MERVFPIQLVALSVWALASLASASLYREISSPTFSWSLFSPPPERPPTVQLTEEQKKYSRKRARFHGLLDGKTVVYNFPDNPYFIRNGKRCKF